MGQALRRSKIREKLLALGAHHGWIVAEVYGKDQTTALRGPYPREVSWTLFFEVSQIEVDKYGDESKRIPVWRKEEHRTGGYEKLDKIVDSATVSKKLGFLMAGISIGQGKT